MSHRTSTIALAAIGLATLAPAASAHQAVVACADDGLSVTPDYLHLDPTWVVEGDTVTVTWTDGYVRRVRVPDGCRPAPEPAPEPPVPEPTPVPPPTPPAVVATPPPVVTTTPPPLRQRRAITCSFIRRHYSGTPERRMLRRHGCAVPVVPAITCRDLLRRGAGPRWYVRLGFPLRCRVNPAVAG